MSGVGSTEPPRSGGAGFAGTGAGKSGVGSTEPPRSGGAGFAGAGAGSGVGSTEPPRSGGAGFAGTGAGRRVVLVDHGAGNVRSLSAALARAGAAPLVTTDPGAVRDSSLAVLAGVGNFARAADGLAPLAEALRERAEHGRPTLGICVGMQLLFEASEEGGCGLGFLRGSVQRLRARRVPHMGWNTLALLGPSSLLEGLDGADVYFAHSYAVEPADDVVVADVEHDGRVVAAVESGPVAGVQFHPERSAAAGARVLENALRWSRSA